MSTFNQNKNSPMVTIYVMDINGNVRSAGQLPKAHAMGLSGTIAQQVRNGGVKNAKVNNPNGAIFREPDVDYASVKKLVDWMRAFEWEKPREPQYLALNRVGSEEFPAIVALYSTGYQFRIPRGIRGELLRDAIDEYIHMAPLTQNEFQMIVECVGSFDQGILSQAMNCTIHAKFSRHPPPELKLIEEYCKEVGLEQKMKDVEEHQRAKRREHEAAQQREQ